MRLIFAYLKLVRFVNLLIVAATMYLLRYFVILPVLKRYGHADGMAGGLFLMLVLSVLCVTAAGYVINDYFDIRVDRVNKPGKLILGRLITRRKAIFLHPLLNAIGIVLGGLTAFLVGNIWLMGIHIASTFFLWMYAIHYQRKFIVGNLIVAILTVLSFLTVWFFEVAQMSGVVSYYQFDLLNRILLLYILFAFVLTLIREIVKDMEDRPGDQKMNYRTIPIVWGDKGAKKVLFVLEFALVVFMIWLLHRLYVAQLNYLVYYSILAVFLPALVIIVKTVSAKTRKDYARLGDGWKIVMTTGVLTMLFVFYYLCH